MGSVIRGWGGAVVAVALATLAACSSGSPSNAAETTWDVRRCPLDRAVINASHVIRVNPAGAVTSVDFVRESDPRAALVDAAPLAAGAEVTLTRWDAVEGFADVSADSLALVGQPRTDLPDEWMAQALAVDDGGTIRFTGPCGPEYDRQFDALQSAFDGADDLAFLERMVDEALLPGRGADLHNVVSGGESVGEVTDALAPRWEGQVRVVWVRVSIAPQGRGGAAGLQSAVGTYGIGRGPDVASSTFELLAVVPKAGRVLVAIWNDESKLVAAPLDLDDTMCRDADGLLIAVNVADLTATCSIGINPAQQAQVEQAQSELRFDHTSAVPEYSDSPPGQY